MCRPSWNWVNGAPLKGCIVWALPKPNWFGQILTDGHVEGLSLCTGFCMQTVHVSMCTCLRLLHPLCLIAKQHNQVLLLASTQWWQLVYGRYSGVSSVFAWCFDAAMYLCVILAPCHSSFLLQASSVNAQLFTVSPAHHLASLIALDLRLARWREST